MGAAQTLTGGDVSPDPHLVMLLVGTAAENPNLKLSDIVTPMGVIAGGRCIQDACRADENRCAIVRPTRAVR